MKLSALFQEFGISQDDQYLLAQAFIQAMSSRGVLSVENRVVDLGQLSQLYVDETFATIKERLIEVGSSLTKAGKVNVTSEDGLYGLEMLLKGSAHLDAHALGLQWQVIQGVTDQMQRELSTLKTQLEHLSIIRDRYISELQGRTLEVDKKFFERSFKKFNSARSLVYLDLDNTMVAAAYRDIQGRSPLIIHNNLIHIYPRVGAPEFIRILSFLGDIKVYTTAKRAYAQGICEHLNIPIHHLYSRRDCEKKKDQYNKYIKEHDELEYQRIWVIDDKPMVWKSEAKKVNIIGIDEWVL